MATNKPSTTADAPLQLDSSLKLSSNEIKSRPLSLEMFNHAASNLDTKGIINLKKYNCYLVKKSVKTYLNDNISYMASDKLPEKFFVDTLTEKAEMLKKHLKDTHSNLIW